MARFYFEIYDGSELFFDEIGQELDNPEAAKAIALAILPGLSVPKVLEQDHHEVAVHVRDENGRSVLTARLCLDTEWAV